LERPAAFVQNKNYGNPSLMKKIIFSVFLVLFFSLFLYGDIYSRINGNEIKYFSIFSFPLNKAVEEQKESTAVYKTLLSQKTKAHRFDVIKIFDGDSIQVKGLDRIFTIRLVGIDCPEIGFDGQKGQPFSQKAKQYLMYLLDHHRVTIKPYGTDAYNRQLAEVFTGTKNLNLEMIKAGLAEVYTGKLPKKFDSQRYLKEEAKARKLGKGMWTQGRFYKRPWKWRKEHPRK